MVTVGQATVIAQDGQLVVGDQANVPAPLPVKVVQSPAHIAAGDALAAGTGFAGVKILTVDVAVPQLLVTVSVYVVVTVGQATVIAQVGQLVVGDQANVPLPLPFSVVHEPAHMEIF